MKLTQCLPASESGEEPLTYMTRYMAWGYCSWTSFTGQQKPGDDFWVRVAFQVNGVCQGRALESSSLWVPFLGDNIMHVVVYHWRRSRVPTLLSSPHSHSRILLPFLTLTDSDWSRGSLGQSKRLGTFKVTLLSPPKHYLSFIFRQLSYFIFLCII